VPVAFEWNHEPLSQNEKCYWRGQCDIINDENASLHD